MLNLGDITAGGVVDSLDTPELLLDAANAEIELSDLLHNLDNYENACGIQEMAKQTNSEECMKFAEKLLGCSMEVDLPNATRIRGKNSAIAQYQKAFDIIQRLVPKMTHEAAKFESLAQKVSAKDIRKHMDADNLKSTFRVEQVQKWTNFCHRLELLVKKYKDAPLMRTLDKAMRSTSMASGAKYIKAFAIELADNTSSMKAEFESATKNGKGPSPATLKNHIGKVREFLSMIRTLLAGLINANRYLAKCASSN